MSRPLTKIIIRTLSTVGVFIMVIILQTPVSYAQNLNFGPNVPNVPNVGTGIQLAYPPSLGSPAAPTAATYDRGIPAGADPVGGMDGTGETIPPAQEVPATTLGNPLYDILYSFVLTVFGSLLAMAGALMSYGMNEFVLGFGTQYFDKNVGSAIESTWTVIRDLFNLTFIFGLVYIGFKMILDSSDSRARSMLISLIGAALLVNFSLFIVKFIIDVANITAVVIAKNGFGGQDIANSFINLINLSTILNISQSQVTFLVQSGGAFSYIFGLMIFLATATFVLAAAGILFIVRFVVLNIYLVMSPVMFIGMVFPSMQSYTTKFWRGFLGNAFFAPAYLLMIYLSFTVLSTYRISLGKSIDYGRLMAGSGDPAEAISMMHAVPFFVLAMAFMIASLVVARNMGAVGASTAISIGNKLRGSAQVAMGAATIGLAARAGQTVVGGGASRLASNQTFKKFAPKSVYTSATKVADASFDARNVAGLGAGIGVGGGMKGGNTTRIKERAESNKKYLDSLGTIDATEAAKHPDVIAAKALEDNAKSALTTAESGVKAQTADARTTIKALETEYKTASDDRKKEIVADINAQNASINVIEKEAEAGLQKLKTEVEKAGAAATKAISKVQYANQLAYLKSLERWNKAKDLATNAAVVIGATTLTGGVGLAAGAAIGGFSFANSSAHNAKKVAKEAEDYVGDDGTNMKKDKEQKKQLAILAELQAKNSPPKTT